MKANRRGNLFPQSEAGAALFQMTISASFLNLSKKKIRNSGRLIKSGDISAAPTDGTGGAKTACEYCEFYAICRVKDEKHIKAEKLSNEECMEQIRKENSQNGNQLY